MNAPRSAFAALCMVAAVLVASIAAPERSEEQEEWGHATHAARFRTQQRLDEHGKIPDNALMRAKAALDAMVAAAPPSPQESVWTWLGPGNIGGRIRSIVIHPTNPTTMWLGSVGGGIWKTTNGGASWAPLDDFLPTLSIGCMIIDPRSPDTLYAGTGEGFFETVEGSSNTAAIRGAGIFRTTDAGASWSQLPSTASPDWYFVNRLAMHPTDSNILIAATGTGMYRSTDAGASWTRTATGFAYDVQYHPTDPTRLVAGFHDGPPRRSTDGGASWTAATGASGHRVEIRYSPSDPTTVYAAVSNDDGIAIHRSIDGGVTYFPRSGSIPTYEAYNNVLWIHPTDPNFLLVGGVYLYRSTNAGLNFSQVFTSVHADHHVIVQDPGFNGSSNRRVYFGNDGGIHRTDDVTGNAAVELNNQLGITQFYGAAVSPAGVILAGAQDNGTSRFTGSTEAWTSVVGGDGGFCAADPSDANYMYAETQWLAIRRSSNGGTSFASVAPPTSVANFIPYFLLDPNNPARMLAAGRELWRTNNVKTGNPPTWTSIKPPLPGLTEEPPNAHMVENDPRNISTIAIARGNPDNVWVGHNNGHVFKTTNATATTPTWTRVDENGVGLPNRWVSRIVIDPVDPAHVYVSVMGWNDANVWRTTDAGATWTDISGVGAGRLPPVPVSALAQHATVRRVLFAGTDLGLFRSGDSGSTWTFQKPGVGNVPVDELVWRNTNTLIAVTHGRGLYTADVTPPDCAADFNDDGQADFFDYLDFVAAYNAEDPAADFNQDGQIDFFDYLDFVAAFDTGCD